MNRLTLWAVVAAVVLTPTVVAAQTVEIQLDPILAIGDSEDAGLEYLFERPRIIDTDSLGNIFVADGQSNQIRMYGPDGRFVRHFGESGEAPGEFVDVSAMTVTRDGRLVVLDRRTDRATVFSTDGDLLETYALDLAAGIWNVVELTSGDLAVNYHSYRDAESNGGIGGNLLHVMTADFSKETQSMLSRNDLYRDYGGVPYVTHSWYRMGDYSHYADDKDNLIIVPDHYDGMIYRYSAADGYSELEVFSTRKMKGLAVEHIELEEWERHREKGLSLASYSGATGRYAGIIRRESVGLARLDTGSLIHFYYEKRDEGTIFAEVRDGSGRFIGETAVHLPGIPDRNRYFNVLHATDDGLIYVAETSLGYAVIRVYRLGFKIIQ